MGIFGEGVFLRSNFSPRLNERGNVLLTSTLTLCEVVTHQAFAVYPDRLGRRLSILSRPLAHAAVFDTAHPSAPESCFRLPRGLHFYPSGYELAEGHAHLGERPSDLFQIDLIDGSQG